MVVLKTMNKIIKVIIVFGVVSYVCFLSWNYIDKNNKQENNEISLLIVNNNEFKVEVADTYEKRVKGLSEREYLPDDTVLLFIFDTKEKHEIWMKDMFFSIDIIWLDEDYYVVDYRENVSPDTFPETFYPEEVAMYVVEANAGFVDKNSINNGDRVVFH